LLPDVVPVYRRRRAADTVDAVTLGFDESLAPLATRFPKQMEWPTERLKFSAMRIVPDLSKDHQDEMNRILLAEQRNDTRLCNADGSATKRR
jgi:hypothetical protein